MAFERAAKLRPQAPEPGAAIAEIDRRAVNGRIAALTAEARALEAREEWWAAIVRYDEALKLDATLAAARDGVARAKPRAAIDVKLQQAIEHSDRLADGEVREQAARLREQAAAIPDPGPRLRQQVSVLDTLLKQAVTEIDVQLQSDEATEIEVYRVGKLGRFRDKTVALVPGRYVAVGSRTGYRDVRVEFTVAHGATLAPVVVRCEQKIAFGGR
jgi:hypothetical protein